MMIAENMATFCHFNIEVEVSKRGRYSLLQESFHPKQRMREEENSPVTFPRVGGCIGQPILQDPAQFPGVFHQQSQQSQGGCDVTIHNALLIGLQGQGHGQIQGQGHIIKYVLTSGKPSMTPDRSQDNCSWSFSSASTFALRSHIVNEPQED